MTYIELLKLKLQKVLQENHADFVDALRLSGIDVEHGVWTTAAIDENAQAGAFSLIQFASQKGISDQCRSKFLRTIAKNLNNEECFSIMAWIYTGYEWTGHFPPYAIIQHMIDPGLFREYCGCLQKHLYAYLQGYFTTFTNID